LDYFETTEQHKLFRNTQTEERIKNQNINGQALGTDSGKVGKDCVLCGENCVTLRKICPRQKDIKAVHKSIKQTTEDAERDCTGKN
jgi:activator of 2-hydroxyglutaryl-CoA dehydratase